MQILLEEFAYLKKKLYLCTMIDMRLITIVGIRHFLHGEEAITEVDERLSSPATADCLLLVPENENIHAPNRAVAAYIGSRKVGYVAETDIEYARIAIGDNLGLGVPYAGLNEKRSAFYVTVEYDDDLVPKEYQPLFSLPPISGLTLPHLDIAHDLLCAHILGYANIDPVQDIESSKIWDELDNPAHPIYTWAREFAESYGQSLSGDDMRAYSVLMEMSRLPQDVCEQLQEIHHHFAATEALCLRVWKREYRRAEKLLTARNGLWSQINAQIEARTQTALALERELRAAMTTLPYDLFALHEKKLSLFASRIYRLHLSVEELDALKTYLVIYEKVRTIRMAVLDEKLPAPLYYAGTSAENIVAFQRDLQKYIRSTNHQTFVPGLVERIRLWERRGVVPRNLGGNITAYCRSLMTCFKCEFDIPNFRKYYRTKKHPDSLESRC